MSSTTSAALLLDESLALSLGEREVAAPVAGQVLLRLEWAGVCGSDLHVLRTGDWVSQWPATIGHEVVGVVVSCPADELAEGARVVVDSRVPCGACAGCTRAANQCDDLRWVGEAMPGGFQQYAVFGVKQVVLCPQTLESAIAVLAEPLAVAMHAVARGGRVPERVLILGYGPIGALVHTELVRQRPSVHVSVVEPDAPRRAMAAAAGAVVASSLSDERWPWVVDAAGHSTALADALEATESGGTVVVVALAHAPIEVSSLMIAERGLTIVGCNGFADELPLAVEALAANPQAYRWLITEAVILDEAAERLATAVTAPAVGKLVIRL